MVDPGQGRTFGCEGGIQHLLEEKDEGTVGNQVRGAYALHEATKRLREKVGEKEFVRWVPFVHFGV